MRKPLRFLPLAKKDQARQATSGGKRLSLDGQATVKLGAFARGGQTRGAAKARDPDFGSPDHYNPCGSVDAATAQLPVTFGSLANPSDFLVDTLTAWWQGLSLQEQHAIERVHLKMDTGPESSGVRARFPQRMVPLVESSGKPISLRYSPPSHSKDNPIERCWGIGALHGKGTQLRDAPPLLEGAKRMTGKGRKPIVELSRQASATGGTLRKSALQAVEARLERNPLLPKWAILISPVGGT